MKTRVLIVEDHPMTLVGLKMLLTKNEGITVVGEASNGLEAVHQAEQTQPEVILMDIGLPEMDGVEATQKIKAAHPGVRIIMLTSKDNERDVFAALSAGADAYCMKGISVEALTSAIEAVKEGTAWLDPAVARMVLGRFQGATPLQEALPSGKAPDDLALQDCPLTAREMEVLRLIVDGLSNPEIAERLTITKATAKAHVHSILQKLCVDDRTQAAVLAMRQGYV
ncbi:response regulator [Vampirovibrio chlorellavorus]|uniref:response regulator n=1 Tax=Vampirovibrio chlorellavorus TaxID=758823 RepID=UPI0026EFBA94|nr:response regulator transcription factor [Vampirovibrio chlorellavorus]